MKSALIRAAAVAGAAFLLLLAATFTPAMMRTLDSFRVQRVEVVGTQHLSGEAAVRASGITSTSNVFDDTAPWLRALNAHPLVAEARIERRLPSTLIVHIRESVPVAFARTPELRAIARSGRILPTDPTDDDMDLPVLAVDTRVSAAGHVVDAETKRIVAFIGTLADLEPALLEWISEIGVHGDAIRLVLRNATDAEVLLPAIPTAVKLHELHATLEELATPRLAVEDSADGAVGRTIEPELSHVWRIDARYEGQIVVAMPGRKS